MVLKKLERMACKPPLKKGLLSRLVGFLHGPNEHGTDTLTPGQDVCCSQQDARPESLMDAMYVPAEIQRKMIAEVEIIKSRRPEQYARRLN